MRSACRLGVWLTVLLLCGCAGLSRDLEISRLAQQQRLQEIIQLLQPVAAQGGEISAFQLFLLASAHYEMRDYRNALATVERLDRRIAAGESRFYGSDFSAYPAIFRARIRVDQGDYPGALGEAAAAHALLVRAGAAGNFGFRSQLIEVAGIMAIAQTHLKREGEARRWLDLITGIDIGESILGPEKYIAIARVHMAARRFDAALAAVRNPAAKVTGLTTAFYDQTFQELPKFFILTKCLYETGDFSAAREGYDGLLKHPQIAQIGGIYWPVLLDRARIARREGQEGAAEGHLKAAVAVIERQRATIAGEAGRIGYVGDKQAVYQELVDLLVAGNRPAEAFEYVERAKGRALVDLLASQGRIAIHGADAGQARTLFTRLETAEGAAATLGGGDAAGTRGVTVSLRRDLADRAPEFTSLVAVTGTPLAEIRARLGADETLLEYYATDRGWFAFLLTRAGIAVQPLGPLAPEKTVPAFRAALTDPASGAWQGYARELHGQLIAPVAGLIGTERLTIVPHGVLHYLPFGALMGGDGALLERARIRVLQSASVLKFLRAGGGQGPSGALIMGNPNLGDAAYDLTHAQEEALAIARILPAATVRLRDEATATFVRQNAARFGILHFAAHGHFAADQPLASALLLSRDGEGDGRLTAGDLYGLRLQADLVTLSACETGLGRLSQGDDVVGFTRGLLYAGAGSIVTTLWKVDDRATRDLMVAFYTNLRTMEKDEALRRAQLAVKQRYPHPFYWAAFQLTGNAR